MAKIGLPKGSGKRLKVREKSGNFEMDIEWQPWHVESTHGLLLVQTFPARITTNASVEKQDLISCQCCLLIIFANGLDPDQAPQHVGPDLDPNCFTL